MSDSTYTAEELRQELSKLTTEHPDLLTLFFSDDEEEPYGISLPILSAMMMSLHMAKDAQYGRSWARHGESGIYQNYMRKEDRLDQLAAVSMLGNNRVEARVALIDTLVDRALYGMMWISYMSKTYPEAFQLWLMRTWCPTTGIPLDDAIELWHVDPSAEIGCLEETN